MTDNTTLELENKIQTDKQELQEIELLLEEDPSNEELLQMKVDLEDLIKQSTELLLSKQRNIIIDSTSILNTSSAPITQTQTTPNSSSTNDISNKLILDSKDILNTGRMTVGTICEAQYSVDDTWYLAEITCINKDGTFTVLYKDYGNTETVTFDKIRPPTRSQKLIENQHLDIPKYLIAPDQYKSIPKSLKVQPEDSEEVKKQKKKQVHNIKTQNRMKQVEEEHKKKKQNWKDFLNKPKKSIPGTFTDKKKVSMFSTTLNLNGKVGVIGSGRGMTEGQSFQNLPKKSCTIIEQQHQ